MLCILTVSFCICKIVDVVYAVHKTMFLSSVMLWHLNDLGALSRDLELLNWKLKDWRDIEFIL